ncbi:MAG: hypothetical protein LC746_08390 [Acidobacteria bacterium]|nr:hypothetical protein [Acidobacteriota bacterium]
MRSKLQILNARVRPSRLTLLVAVVALCAPLVAVRAQQPPPAGKMKLTKIEVVGLKRLKEDEVVAASGLQAGQTLGVDDFDAAAQKLLSSGLVTKVGYKLRERGGEATVVFEVTEAERGSNMPVVFDNFVWFTPEEIAAAVKREVPAFDGTAADSSLVIEGIKRALEGLLRERKIAATVEYMASSNLDTGGERKHVFAARGVTVPVCAQRGYLRVEFGEPAAALAGDCGANGVAVSVPVREGLAYNWGGARWTGNEALPVHELNFELGMKPGELADATKIKRSLGSVSRAYGRKGYLAISIKPQPEFDDATRTVTYTFDVREGAQYHMGALRVTGLADEAEQRVREKWALKEGDVYDAGYVEAFIKQAVTEVTRATGKPVRVSVDVVPDAQRKAVDVTLAFKSG